MSAMTALATEKTIKCFKVYPVCFPPTAIVPLRQDQFACRLAAPPNLRCRVPAYATSPTAGDNRYVESYAFLAFAGLCFLSCPAVAQPPGEARVVKSVQIPQLADRPTIDGVLDEALWSQAALIEDLHQVFPEEYGTPTQPTHVRVFYTQDALYVGARMVEADAEQITGRVLRQGQSLDADDVFAVILDPYLDRRNGYRFEVNPNGVRWEGLFQNIVDVESNWDGIWEARAQKNEDGWV